MRIGKPSRRSRPRRKRKGGRAAQKRQCDRLWSYLVKRPGKCEICGKTFNLQAAHGFSSRYLGTRWNLLNGFCLCSADHLTKSTYDPIFWDDYIRKAWGEPVYQELKRLAQTVTKPDYDAILASLRKEL